MTSPDEAFLAAAEAQFADTDASGTVIDEILDFLDLGQESLEVPTELTIHRAITQATRLVPVETEDRIARIRERATQLYKERLDGRVRAQMRIDCIVALAVTVQRFRSAGTRPDEDARRAIVDMLWAAELWQAEDSPWIKLVDHYLPGAAHTFEDYAEFFAAEAALDAGEAERAELARRILATANQLEAILNDNGHSLAEVGGIDAGVVSELASLRHRQGDELSPEAQRRRYLAVISRSSSRRHRAWELVLAALAA